ncbi:site-specific integrase [Vibrio parahaemolyticus]|uniref:site-specific integrase n=1 Tax=Vibrio parahaemolyticus TaxID=670 RepID=UPI0023619012|nr:site-specific integrase [Vibrio parahaemolyticus]HDY7465244.1 site-specific integrase [Vibrio vulnificus]
MATKAIEPVNTQRGTRYKARVRVTSQGKTIGQCCKTFDTYPEAEKWAQRTAKLADKEGIKGLQKAKKNKRILISDVINMTLTKEPTVSNLRRSKRANLKMLLRYPIAKVPVEDLSAKVLFEHCQLRCKRVKPQTASHDISNLCTALKDAITFYGISCDCTVFNDARSSLQRHGFIARSDERIRRPTHEELQQISAALETKESCSTRILPLSDIVELAMETALRRGEIVKIQRRDYCKKTKTIVVRDRKGPRKSQRHTTKISLSEKALEVLEKHSDKKDDDFIFDYKADAISRAWSKLTKDLKIKDLRFHDLRAEAASRLFESGLRAPEVAQITGHRCIDILNRHYLRLNLVAPTAN